MMLGYSYQEGECRRDDDDDEGITTRRQAAQVCRY